MRRGYKERQARPRTQHRHHPQNLDFFLSQYDILDKLFGYLIQSRQYRLHSIICVTQKFPEWKRLANHHIYSSANHVARGRPVIS